jgi:hypothetical protein
VEKYCRAGQATDYNMANAFPLQQWLHERASALRYTYVACLVNFIISYIKNAIMAVVRTTLKA